MFVSKIFIESVALPLTTEQMQFAKELDSFFLKKEEKATFLLCGYAGTGKTLMVSSLVRVASKIGYKVALLAPTGRAAKVLGGYAKKRASTIHRKIYQQTDTKQGKFVFKRVKNTSDKTIYIVDEASMISDKADFGSKSLLSDLIAYIFENPEAENKLFLVGDIAQLPPVGENISVALDKDYLAKKYNLAIQFCEFTQVMRQEEHSGILYNATLIRNQLRANQIALKLKSKIYKDFYRMTAEKLEDGLRYAYNKYSIEDTIVVCRSNKNANNFNQYIRRHIRFSETEIEAGDYLMIVKNNYFVLAENGQEGFLANGDFVEILKIRNEEEEYGFRFATMELRLVDYPETPSFEAKVILDTLYTEHPSMPAKMYEQLYEQVFESYADISQHRKRQEALKDDPYLNALQVKFAYAITCHKSQGGQWKAVFVEQGFMTEAMLNTEFLRWLYTAITRAEKELFLVNFRPQFFEDYQES
ncbi:MAG: ATP-binding domain-containing protein [Raineya sp.]